MNTTVNTHANVTTNRVNNKIQDFGQKIGGARKDMAKEAADLVATLAGLTVERLKELSLSKLVKFEQVQRLAASGAISAPAACAAFALWRSIPARPSLSCRIRKWAENTTSVLAEISAIIDGAEITEKVKRMAEYRVLMSAGYPSTPFAFGRYRVDYYFTVNSPLCVLAGNRYKLRTYDPSEAADYIRKAVSDDAAQRAQGATFELYSCGSVFYAAPKGKNKIRVKEWATREDARAGMENVEELRRLWDDIRNTPSLRRSTNRPRIGADYRNGQDTTPETFAAAFPFRGVEFGNWLTQMDRLVRLNETFDALRDLCALCGLTADAVTLKSWLAMAFGSRGIPGSAAHFEHDHRVINLTKEHGAGSLAHEWFHALDAFTAARFDGWTGQMSVKDWGRLPEGELREAARALYSGLMKSPFARRSEDLDYIKGKRYYATANELAARAFEVYVIELAKIQGWQLDFLANVTTSEEWMAAYGDADEYPYPTPEEVAELAPLFARFLSIAADANELSKEAEELFSDGRAVMEQQREKVKELQEQAAKEQAELRAAATAARLEEMKQRTAEVCAECGASWSYVFESSGRAYAVGGGAGFAFNIWANGYVGYKVVRHNPRLKKSIRTVWGDTLEVRTGVDLETFARKDLEHGFTGCSLYNDVFDGYASTWKEFSDKHAANILKGAQELALKKPATDAKTSEQTNTKADGQKAAEKPVNGENSRRQIDTTAAPSDGLSLVELPEGGVAVVGADWKDTYFHKREIKAHGCTWNKEAKQWQATDPEVVASIRTWFGQDSPTDGTPTTEATQSAQECSTHAEGQGVEFNAEGLEALRQKFAEMEAKETAEGATDQAPEADTMDAPTDGQELAESEAVASGAPRYSICEKSPISEKSGAGSPFSPSFPCWGVFEFVDEDSNSHEPRLVTSFDTEAKAREWLQKCAEGTGALCVDAVDVMACDGGFWMVWYSDRSVGYYCQYVAQRADARDVSGALMQCESLNLRQRLHDFKREHMARQMAEKVAKLQAGEVYAVDYDGEGVTAENDSANAGRYVVTFWSYGEMKERQTDRTAAEAAQAVADFVAVYVPAMVWTSHRNLLHTFNTDEIPYYRTSEKSQL